VPAIAAAGAVEIADEGAHNLALATVHVAVRLGAHLEAVKAVRLVLADGVMLLSVGVMALVPRIGGRSGRANGKQTSLLRGDATLDDDGRGQSLFSEPEGQSVALPEGTLFPHALTRATIQHAKAEDGGFDALFFYGEKVKPPQSLNLVIGRVPKRLADFKLPEGAEALTENRARIYYRGAFFEADPKGQTGEAAYEMSSLMLDNGIELYGTHEESDGGIEYRITRLEPLPRPECSK